MICDRFETEMKFWKRKLLTSVPSNLKLLFAWNYLPKNQESLSSEIDNFTTNIILQNKQFCGIFYCFLNKWTNLLHKRRANVSSPEMTALCTSRKTSLVFGKMVFARSLTAADVLSSSLLRTSYENLILRCARYLSFII